MTMFDFLYGKMPEYFDEKAILYHYTSVDVLNKFLKDDGDLYCTHFGVLNDSSEMMIGLSIAENYLRKRFKWSEMKCIWFRENYNLLVRSGDIVVPWVMSFSREKDSLNQWGMYTSRETGGVAVGFEMGLLWTELDRFPGCYSKAALTAKGEKGDIQDQDRAFELRLLPCLYAESDADIIYELIEMRLNPHADTYERISNATSDQDVSPEDFTQAIISILEVSSVIKHEAFKNEKEVRLVLLPMTKSLADCELIGCKPRWKTYVCETRREGVGNPKRQALRGMIKEVIISPHGDTDTLWTIARCLLDKYEMSWCKLEKSALPYNAR